jgi:tRNA uridine 5-carboxymethylaminomethyl modification enzyme
MFFDEIFDVLVIGAGHAGCEAASVSARMGMETALVTINLDLIGQMSCNPAIGGIAKGHIVREIDALGGIMGRIIDRTGIQFRLLNRSRGPAVQSPRAQADRSLYRIEMRRELESHANLHLRQGVVVDLITENNKIIGVELQDTRKIKAKAVIIAAGTFLNGTIHTGRKSFSAGRSGEPASIELAEKLKLIGFPVGRLKTGTPPRLDARTIDWNAFEKQPGDEQAVAFSFATEEIEQPQIDCYIGYTNENLHEHIRLNLHESPLYSGKIKGIGPRYCPSIEDKVVKFAAKDRHQLFLEPEGHNTNEVYLNGFSTSLPADIQQTLLRFIKGFENVKIIRPGYAIEYDFVDPRQLKSTLETTKIEGLFFAGQINGTTGYEEAACQGLMAGINAALSIQKREPLILRRDEAYIGVLISDLIQHGVDEPYRIFTSRAESRLTLRHDNADSRLSYKCKGLGLLSDNDWNSFNEKQRRISNLRNVLTSEKLKPNDTRYAYVSNLLNADLGDAISLSLLAQRQGVDSHLIYKLLPESLKTDVKLSDIDSALADLLYSGYIKSQANANERLNRNDNLKIPEKLNFSFVNGLSAEMIERLERASPRTFGEVKAIPGLTNSALSTLLVYLSCQTDS